MKVNKRFILCVTMAAILVFVAAGCYLLRLKNTSAYAYRTSLVKSSFKTQPIDFDGVLKSVFVNDDDFVKKGQKVAEVYAYQPVKVAITPLKQGNNAFEKEYSEIVSKYKDGIISQEEYDVLLSNLDKKTTHNSSQAVSQQKRVVVPILAPDDGYILFDTNGIGIGESFEKDKLTLNLFSEPILVEAVFRKNAKIFHRLHAGQQVDIIMENKAAYKGTIKEITGKDRSFIYTTIAYDTDNQGTEYKKLKPARVVLR